MAAEHLDECVPGEGLLDLCVQFAGVLPLGDEQLLRPPCDQHRHDERERDGDECDQREERRHDEHHHDDADHREQGGEQLAQRLLQGLRDVVDVVRDPAQELAPLHPVEVFQRKPVDLRLDLFAQAVHRALGDPVQHVRLHVAEERGEDVERQHSHQHHAERMEVDPGARREGHAAQQVGLLAMACCAKARNHLILSQPLGHSRRDRSGDDDVDGVAEDLRSEHCERHADDAEDRHEDDAPALRGQAAGEALGARPEVHRLLRGALHAAERSTSAGPAPHDRARWRLLFSGAHAASSAVSWDETISA